MWGNNNIKNINIWGLKRIPYTETKYNNKVYTTCMGNIPCVKVFNYTENIDVGNYILHFMPNYIKHDNVLVLQPDIIPIDIPQFFDIKEDVLGGLIFGNYNIAEIAINIFGSKLLRGEITDYVLTVNNFKKKLINFWNTVNLDIPFIWSVIADWVCKNAFELKKYLKPKNLIHSYKPKPSLPQHKPITNGIFYIYYENNTYMKSDVKPENKSFGMHFIKEKHVRNMITNKKNINVKAKIKSNTLIFYESDFKIKYTGLINNNKYICVDNNNKLIMPILELQEIAWYPLSGLIINDFRIICPDSLVIKTNLELLAQRSLYFAKINNFPPSFIKSDYDLTNLIDFIINVKCNSNLNYKKELKIAEIYECPEYKFYLLNLIKSERNISNSTLLK